MHRALALTGTLALLAGSCSDPQLEDRVTSLESRLETTEKKLAELEAIVAPADEPELETEPTAATDTGVETGEETPGETAVASTSTSSSASSTSSSSSSRSTSSKPAVVVPTPEKVKEAAVYATARTAAPFTLKTLLPGFSGAKSFSMERYVGENAKKPKKALLVYFVSAACQSCLNDLPYFAEMQKYNGRYGLGVVLVSTDRDKGDIEAFKSAAAKGDPQYVLVSDRFNVVKKRYAVTRLPHGFLLDSKAVILAEFVGGTQKMKKALKAQVAAALQ